MPGKIDVTSTSTLKWAIPVNLLQLGARLEALGNITPAATTLMLCKRYGRGPLHAPKPTITRFPNELIDIIINEMLVIELEKQKERWQQMRIWGTHAWKSFKGQSRCNRTDCGKLQLEWRTAVREHEGLENIDKILKSRFGLSVQLFFQWRHDGHSQHGGLLEWNDGRSLFYQAFIILPQRISPTLSRRQMFPVTNLCTARADRVAHLINSTTSIWPL